MVGRGTTSRVDGNRALGDGLSDVAVPEGHDVRADIEGTHVGLAVMHHDVSSSGVPAKCFTADAEESAGLYCRVSGSEVEFGFGDVHVGMVLLLGPVEESNLRHMHYPVCIFCVPSEPGEHACLGEETDEDIVRSDIYPMSPVPDKRAMCESSSRHHDHDAVLEHPSIFLECLGSKELGLFGICLEVEGLTHGANLTSESFGHSGECAVGDDNFLFSYVAWH